MCNDASRWIAAIPGGLDGKVLDGRSIFSVGSTVMDSDTVLVIDAGKIVKYDHPFELFKTDGFFKLTRPKCVELWHQHTHWSPHIGRHTFLYKKKSI